MVTAEPPLPLAAAWVVVAVGEVPTAALPPLDDPPQAAASSPAALRARPSFQPGRRNVVADIFPAPRSMRVERDTLTTRRGGRRFNTPYHWHSGPVSARSS